MISFIGALAILLALALPAHADQFWQNFGGSFLGGAAGSVIGNVITRPQPPPPPPPQQQYYPPPPLSPDQIVYCSRKYKTWNPQTALFVGYDGQFHRCP